MAERTERAQRYSVGGGGNVFTDRLYGEHPVLKGEEISQEEYRRLVEEARARAAET